MRTRSMLGAAWLLEQFSVPRIEAVSDSDSVQRINYRNITSIDCDEYQMARD